MPLTKTDFVQQPENDPSCFGCAAAMAAGKSLADFKAFIGRDSNLDRKGYSYQEVTAWLLDNGMGFTPLGYLSNHQVCEEVPGVELKVTIDADTNKVLEGYAEQLGMALDGAVNGILTRALTQYGARSREGYRYTAPVGHDFSKYSGGFIHYAITMDSPAIVVVLENIDIDHALYWDGSLLWNPNLPEHKNPVYLSDYKVAAWFSVGKFTAPRIVPNPSGILVEGEVFN